MTRAKISEYDASAANNTDVNGVNIAEGCPPSSMNNMGREIMAALKRFETGADGDSLTVGGNFYVTGTSGFSGTIAGANQTLSGTLGVTGASTFTGTLAAVNNATVGGTLGVTGASTFTGTLAAVNNATVGGTLGVTGAATFTGTLAAIGNATVGGTLGVTGASTFTGTLSAVGNASIGGRATMKAILETTTVTGSAPATTSNYDVITQVVQFYTTNAARNFAFNIRGDGSSSLNSIMSTGQSVSLALLVTNGSTAYYPNTFQIDGAGVTPKWQGGTAPTAGNASSVDAYVFTAVKTADATFTLLASQTKFA